MLAFNHVEKDSPDRLKVGLAVRAELEKAGFGIEWSGSVDHRISIPAIDWKRRQD